MARQVEQAGLGFAIAALAAIAPGPSARAQLLDAAAVRERAAELPDWGTDGRVLYASCEVADFVAAVAFVDRLVAPAEELAHHPDLRVSYGRVEIAVTTHEAGGLTAVDYELAAAISAVAAGMPEPPACAPTR